MGVHAMRDIEVMGPPKWVVIWDLCHTRLLSKFPKKGPKKGPILKGVGFGPINLENMTGHVPTFWGWFWVHARNIAHVRPRSKKWVQKLKPKLKGDRA